MTNSAGIDIGEIIDKGILRNHYLPWDFHSILMCQGGERGNPSRLFSAEKVDKRLL